MQEGQPLHHDVHASRLGVMHRVPCVLWGCAAQAVDGPGGPREAADSRGHSLLMTALSMGHVDAVRLLLRAGLSPTAWVYWRWQGSPPDRGGRRKVPAADPPIDPWVMPAQAGAGQASKYEASEALGEFLIGS